MFINTPKKKVLIFSLRGGISQGRKGQGDQSRGWTVSPVEGLRERRRIKFRVGVVETQEIFRGFTREILSPE